MSRHSALCNVANRFSETERFKDLGRRFIRGEHVVARAVVFAGRWAAREKGSRDAGALVAVFK
ncbi:MAG TPA: hypothetical protein VE621_03805 [Bryobacteraceae bacterium]|nr:hypothetical protein [Bryobacteraceae bacterium]